MRTLTAFLMALMTACLIVIAIVLISIDHQYKQERIFHQKQIKQTTK